MSKVPADRTSHPGVQEQAVKVLVLLGVLWGSEAVEAAGAAAGKDGCLGVSTSSKGSAGSEGG